jgi:hypothetical protein
MENEINHDDLELQLITRLSDLKLPFEWNFIIQTMCINFWYCIDKAVIDANKYEQEKENKGNNI